jgi:hypothetical protein
MLGAFLGGRFAEPACAPHLGPTWIRGPVLSSRPRSHVDLTRAVICRQAFTGRKILPIPQCVRLFMGMDHIAKVRNPSSLSYFLRARFPERPELINVIAAARLRDI